MKILEKINYFFINKFRIISLFILWLLPFKFKGVEPILNPKLIKNLGDESKKIIPKKIWMYWEGSSSEVLNLSINQIIKLNNNFDFFLLDEKNVNLYVDGIEKFKFPTVQHKSDYIRLYLLNKHGGVWCDASIIFFGKIDSFINMLEEKIGFFAFFNEYRSNNKNKPIIENWFLIASKGHPFIKKWLEEYIYALQIGNVDYIKKISNNAELFQRIGKDEREYLFNYVCAQRVLQDFENDYLFLSCDETAFHFNLVGGWRYKFFKKKSFHYTNIIRSLCLYKRPENLPMLIKLVAGDRDHLNFYLEKKIFKKDTLIDYLYNQER